MTIEDLKPGIQPGGWTAVELRLQLPDDIWVLLVKQIRKDTAQLAQEKVRPRTFAEKSNLCHQDHGFFHFCRSWRRSEAGQAIPTAGRSFQRVCHRVRSEVDRRSRWLSMSFSSNRD
jgi:hypothetical protein